MATKSSFVLSDDDRAAYATKCRAFADKMRAENDMLSAALNDWMADNYSKPARD